MKKEPDQHFMQPRRLTTQRRWMNRAVAVAILASLSLSACTNYRPVGKGANVPWAKALVAARGGPLEGNRYRVEQGDALSQIASRYNVHLASLAQANNIPPPYVLYPGEVLRIPTQIAQPARPLQVKELPLPPSAPSAQPSKSVVSFEAEPRRIGKAPLPAPQPSAVKARPKPKPAPVVAGKRHVVVAGENLALIAERNGLRLSELVAANKVEEPYRIKPGQILIIPNRDLSVGQGNQPVRRSDAASGSSMSPSPPLSTKGFMWPVHGSLIGNFDQPGSGGRSGGVNIAIRKGTPVRASENGIVAYAGEALSGYGRLVMLRHAEGYVTLYAHNDRILVREGDVVARGQAIAEAGDSGDVNQSQVHFEIRKGKEPIDPTKVVAGLPGRQIGAL